MARNIASRITVEHGLEGPKISIRAKCERWSAVLLIFWLLIMLFGAMPSNTDYRNHIFVLLFFGVMELVLWIVWFWMIIGREEIYTTHDVITMTRRIGRFAIKRSFPLRDCTDLRASGWFPPVTEDFYSSVISLFTRTCSIAYDCRGKTERFGMSLTEEDARSVVEELSGSISLYTPKGITPPH